MDILHKRYFGRLIVMRSSDVEENLGPRASHRPCSVVYVNIRACIRICQICLLGSKVKMWFFVLKLLSLPGATFSSLRFRVLADRCSCSGARLICFGGWLYTCIMAFWRTDSAVISVDVVKPL